MLRPLYALLSALAFTSAAASLDLTTRQTNTTACNNSPDLCSRAYNEIVHLGAHNSPFLRDSSTSYSTSGNQYYNSSVQLSAGVRLLSAQVHKENGSWRLCHSSCDLLDAGSLTSWLIEIRTWLENNPNDVVTILLVNSDSATASELDAQFTAANITDLAYTPASTTTAIATWPTLQTLINAGTRLMVFVASLDTSTITSSQSYLMDEFTFIFENPYENTDMTNFNCTPDRPTAIKGNVEAAIGSNRMAFTNHFLYEQQLFDIQIPAVDNITTTNAPGSSTGMLGAALNSCKSSYGKVPTFTLVDFFDQGPAIDAVDTMNGITPVGRTAVPARNSESSSSDSKAASFAGITELNTQVQSGETPKLGAWIWGAGKWSFGGINLSGGSLVS